MLHYYYYKIYNTVNENIYIGITSNPTQREKQHWKRLRNNTHPNPHLQLAWNKYGEDKFHFEVIEDNYYETKEDAYFHESELIKKFNSIEQGYNCNPGGLWTGPKGKFTESEVYYIKAACYFNKRATGVLTQYFKCKEGTIDNVRCNRNYRPYGEHFDQLSEEEKIQWYEEFCDLSNFELLKYSIYAHNKARKYTKEQIFVILRWIEHKFTTAKNICDSFNIEYPNNPNYRCANKFREIKDGKTYKDYIAEYKTLTEQQKVEIERLYTEMYIEESL